MLDGPQQVGGMGGTPPCSWGVAWCGLGVVALMALCVSPVHGVPPRPTGLTEALLQVTRATGPRKLPSHHEEMGRQVISPWNSYRVHPYQRGLYANRNNPGRLEDAKELAAMRTMYAWVRGLVDMIPFSPEAKARFGKITRRLESFCEPKEGEGAIPHLWYRCGEVGGSMHVTSIDLFDMLQYLIYYSGNLELQRKAFNGRQAGSGLVKAAVYPYHFVKEGLEAPEQFPVEAVGALVHLKKFDLSLVQSGDGRLPGVFFRLPVDLEVMKCVCCGIRLVDWHGLDRYSKVKKLSFRSNYITEVDFGGRETFPALRSLDLSYNRIASLERSAVERKGTLRSLKLSGNILTELTIHPSLRRLHMQYNRLSTTPAPPERVQSNLVHLDVRNNLLEGAEGVAAIYPRLKAFRASFNQIREIDLSEIVHMRADGTTPLAQIQLSHNNMTRLSCSVEWKSLLYILAVNHNRLTSVDPRLMASSINILMLGNNQLTEVPLPPDGVTLGARRMILRHNHIARVPKSILAGRLRLLDLSYNRFTALPSVSDLRIRLDLQHNPIKALPTGFEAAMLADRINSKKLILGVGRWSTAMNGFAIGERKDVVLATELEIVGITFEFIYQRVYKNRASRIDNEDYRFSRVIELTSAQQIRESEEIRQPNIGLHSVVLFPGPQGQVLERFPDAIYQIDSLVGIVADHHSIKLEDRWLNTTVEVVSLRHNGIRNGDLPQSLLTRPHLILDVSHNELTEVPVAEYRHASLNMRNNKITGPARTTASLMITGMDLRNNMIENGEWIEGFAYGLSTLRMSFNPLRSLAVPKSLTTLEISDCILEDLVMPADSKLKLIYAQNNNLKRFPEHVPPLLVEADFSHNKLEEVPVELARVTHVNLAHNRLKRLPVVPANFATYMSLDLDFNGLEEFPISWLTREDMKGQSRYVDSMAGVMDRLYRGKAALTEPPGVICSLRHNFIKSIPTDFVVARSQIFIDRDALGPDWKDNVRQMVPGNIRWERSSEIQQLPGALVCSEDVARSAVEGTKSTRVVVLSCECDQGFYRAQAKRNEPLTCLPCVSKGTCSNGAIACNDGWYLEAAGDKAMQSCAPCPDGATCTENEVYVNPGYWSPPANPSTVYECIRPSSCLGVTPPGSAVVNGRTRADVNAISMDEYREARACAEHSGGPLCGVCEAYYYASSTGSCVLCPSLATSIVTTLCIGGGTVMVLAFIAVLGVRSVAGSRGTEDLALPMNTRSSKDSGGAGFASASLRMGVDFVQVISVFPQLYAVQWPDVFTWMDEYLGWVDLELFSPSSLGCVWDRMTARNHGMLQYPHFLLMLSIAPLALGAVGCGMVIVTHLVRGLIRPAQGVNMDWVHACTARFLTVVMLYAYLPVSSRAIGYFRCMAFDDGTGEAYLYDDLSFKCYDDTWYAFLPLALAVLVMFTVSAPVLLLVLLLPVSMDRYHMTRWVVPAKIAEWSRRLHRLSFSFYKKEFAWWDALEMIRKVFIASAVIHLGGSSQYQICVAMLTCFLVMACHVAANPFVTTYLNTVHSIELSLIFFTLSIGLLKSLQVPTAQRTAYYALVLGLDVLFVATIAIYAAIVMLSLAWTYLTKRRKSQ